MNYLEEFENISIFIFDVDGVLTNGDLLITESGKLLRKMNVKDGFAMKYALEQGYQIAIISGGNSLGVKVRLEGLGIKDIFIGVKDKIRVFDDFLDLNNINPNHILYMGDDLPDAPVMRLVGLPACPNDAVHEIKKIAQYISPLPGGKGCVRDVIERVLKIHGKWNLGSEE